MINFTFNSIVSRNYYVSVYEFGRFVAVPPPPPPSDDRHFVALFNPWRLEGTAGVSTMTFTVNGVDLWSITVENAGTGDISDIYQTVVVRTDPGIVSRSGFLDDSATSDLDLDLPWQSPDTYIDVDPSFFVPAGTARVTLTTDGTTSGTAEIAIVRVVFDGTNWQYAPGPDKRLDLETFGTSDPDQSFFGGTIYLSDNFTAADGTNINGRSLPGGTAIPATWTTGAILGSNSLTIQSNTVPSTSGSLVYSLSDCGHADHKVRMKVTIPIGNNSIAEFLVRCSDSTSSMNGYMFDPSTESTENKIYKVVSGSSTTVLANFGSALLSQDTTYYIEFEANGSNLTGRIYASDGTTLLNTLSATDSTYATGSYVGFRPLKNISIFPLGPTYDDFTTTAV